MFGAPLFTLMVWIGTTLSLCSRVMPPYSLVNMYTTRSRNPENSNINFIALVLSLLRYSVPALSFKPSIVHYLIRKKGGMYFLITQSHATLQYTRAG